MAEVAPDHAAIELLRRERARASLIEFSQSIAVPGVPLLDPNDEVDEHGRLVDPIEHTPTTYEPIELRVAIHHALMMQGIQRCIETPRGRFMCFAPPGSAKSTYAAVLGSAWAMGKWPGTQVILGSYATNIAVKQSRKVRSIARDPAYSSIWQSKPKLLEDQRAVDDWSLTNGSSLMAAGLLAGITGNRCDLLIIDDPVANRENADSPTLREKTYNEYIDTAMTRAKPKMSVIIIQTRWHEEDLAGAILPEWYNGESGSIKCRDGQTWEVLSIPAEAEREDDPLGRAVGEFLWPEWFPKEHWSTWRDNPRAARTWSALYQQRPAPFTGIHFSRDMFLRYNPDLPRVDV
jgi:hypothetical protein